MKFNKWIIGLGLILCTLSFWTGCDKNNKSHRQEANQQETIVFPDGKEVVAVLDETIIPSTETKGSTFTGQGITYRRQVDASRIASPWSIGAGAVIAKQEPAKIATSETPGINITPDGVGVTKGTQGAFTGGGSHFTWWDTLKVWLNDSFVWLLVIGGIILVIFGLSFIPGTVGTIFSGIWNWIKSILTLGITAITNWWKNRKTTVTVSQTVTGIDTAKDAIEKLTIDEAGYLKEVKPQDIIELINTSLQIKQDASSKEMVKEFRTR